MAVWRAASAAPEPSVHGLENSLDCARGPPGGAAFSWCSGALRPTPFNQRNKRIDPMKIRTNHLTTVAWSLLAASGIAHGQDSVRQFGGGTLASNGLRAGLQADGLPVIGNSEFALRMSNLPPESAAAVLMAGTESFTPFGNDSILVELPGFGTAAMGPVSGDPTSAQLAFPIPNDPSLAGARFFFQGIYIDSGNGGVAVTNALEVNCKSASDLAPAEGPFKIGGADGTLRLGSGETLDPGSTILSPGKDTGTMEVELLLDPTGAGDAFEDMVDVAYAWCFRDQDGNLVDLPGNDYLGAEQQLPELLIPRDAGSAVIEIPMGVNDGHTAFAMPIPASGVGSYELELFIGDAGEMLIYPDREPAGHVWDRTTIPVQIGEVGNVLMVPRAGSIQVHEDVQIFVRTADVQASDRYVDLFASENLELQSTVAYVPANSNHGLVLATPMGTGTATITAIYPNGDVVTSETVTLIPTSGFGTLEGPRHPEQPESTGSGYSCSQGGGGDLGRGPVFLDCGPCDWFQHTTPPKSCKDKKVGDTAGFSKWGDCYKRWVGTNLCCAWSTATTNAKVYKLTSVTPNSDCGFSLSASIWSLGGSVSYFSYCCEWTWTGNRGNYTYPRCQTGLYAGGRCSPL